ncbi:MAG: chromosome segregation protein SMC [Chloroflexota bacterium]
MKLKRLTLQGYKTFAARTEFVFDEMITAVVGPNGSGKSNLADAVRWVLGEQSYGALRGKRTTDMIFAGSQSRARAGMAQAILTLDNDEGWLPVDYTEVAIGRRAHRTGENEYLLNGQQVRLREITDLLATSGLAERTYTIIGQGLIDQALSLRAEERRALFEEAAGVSHYKARRAETLRQLEETQRNLQRVLDILAEIKPRLGSLKRQAQRTKAYDQVAADLHHLLRAWYGYQWGAARRAVREQRGVAAEAEQLWQAAHDHLTAAQERLAGQRRLSYDWQRQAQERQTALDALRPQLNQAGRQVAILKERRQQVEKQLAEIEQDEAALSEQQAVAQTASQQAAAELRAAQVELSGLQERWTLFKSSLAAQQGEIDRARQSFSQLERQRQERQTKLAQAQGYLTQLQEREKEKAREPEGEGGGLEEKLARAEAAVTAAQATLTEWQGKRPALQSERQQVNEELRRARPASAESGRLTQALDREIAGLEARRELLEQMRQPALPQALRVPLVGQLATLLTIPDAYQTALEAALAARLGTLVTADERGLWRLVHSDHAARSLWVAAADQVQPPPSPATPDHPSVIGWASDLIGCAEEARPVAQLLLGQVLLVRQAQAAFQIARTLPPGALAVTLDGFVAHAGGLVSLNGHDPQASLLARERAWRESTAALTEKKGQRAQAQAEADRLQAEVRRLQKTLDRLNEQERQISQGEQAAGQGLNQAQRDLERLRQQQSYQERERANRTAELQRLAERISQTEKEMAGHQKALTQLEAAVATARAALQQLPAVEAEQQQRTWRQQTQAAEALVAGRQAAVDSRRSTHQQVEGQLARLQLRRQELQKQFVQADLEAETERWQALQAQRDQLERELRPLQAQWQLSQQEQQAMENEVATSQKQAHELEGRLTQARIALGQKESSLETLLERIRAELGLVDLAFDDDQTGQAPLPLTEVVEQLPAVAELPEDIEENVQRLRTQLHRMGAINPDAPREYEETQQRYDFLSQQVEDLQKTESHLRQIISELDDSTARAFGETVEQVNAVFGGMFRQLFGGGSARLTLTEPDDLTQSGVDIVAQLPGRRQQGLALLSGGERSLTAAALIFALLKVSPTPFCILDEVDAMLDEANVGRFRDALCELSQKTQFIVITHNRGTVQAAQTVYGISMGQDSASQVISIKPENYVREE